jgi:hypothetical protein
MLRAAQSGAGARVDAPEELMQLMEYAASRGQLICNLETFEVAGEFETPRIDLSIYGVREAPGPRHETPLARACEEIRRVVTDIRTEGMRTVFQVWTSDSESLGGC